MADIVFTVSEGEMGRRQNAFTSFLASLYLCLILLSVLEFPSLLAEYRSFAVLAALGVLLLFTFFRVVIAGFFESFRKSKIIVTPTYFERITRRSVEQFPIREISGIRIKKTSRGTVREIGILLTNKSWQYIDGLNDLDSLGKYLINVEGKKDIKLQMSNEPIDYDSAAFYPLLGLLLGTATVFGVKLAAGLDYGSLYTLFLAFAVYLAVLGGYFIMKKPLTIRYGYTSKSTDYLMGSIILAASILIGASAFSWMP